MPGEKKRDRARIEIKIFFLGNFEERLTARTGAD